MWTGSIISLLYTELDSVDKALVACVNIGPHRELGCLILKYIYIQAHPIPGSATTLSEHRAAAQGKRTAVAREHLFVV